MIAEGLRLSVSGLLRGHDLSGPAVVVLDDDALRLDTADAVLRLPLAWLDGVRYAVGTLELFVRRGDVVVMSGSANLGMLASAIEQRVMTIPELTRSLRALGSGRGSPGVDHDRFFGVLLDARREAERSGARSPDRARAAFDAVTLRDALVHRLEAVSRERHPDAPPERRALDAEMLEVAEPLLTQLGALERAQDALAASEDAERLARWSDWARVLRDVFESADAVWLALARVLAAEPPTRAPRWRRSRRGEGDA